MPETVVDDFEVVEIEEQDRERVFSARCHNEPLPETVVEERAVRQTRNGVGVREVPQVTFKLVAL
jgi:hypothetical protein